MGSLVNFAYGRYLVSASEKKLGGFICKKSEIQLAHQIDGYLAISRGNSISPEMEMQSSTKLLLFLMQFISFANKPLGSRGTRKNEYVKKK